MASRYWVGSNGSAWSNTAAWSASQGGAGGASVPVAGDDVYIIVNPASVFYLGVNQNIGNINKLVYESTNPTVSYTHLGAFASSGAGKIGTTWTLTAPTEIEVRGTSASTTAATNFVILNSAITGAGKITKTGPAMFYMAFASSNAGWSGGIDIQAGTVAYEGTNDKFGTGTVRLYNGAAILRNVSAGSMTNNIEVVSGTGYVNAFAPAGPPYSGGYTISPLTTSGGLIFGDTNKTLHVGTSTFTVTGAVTGTGGFTKTGAGTLALTNASPAFTQAVTVSGGALGLGDYLTTTAALTNASSFSVASGASVTFINTTDRTVTADVNVVAGGFLYAGSFSPTGSTVHTHTGAITGAGRFVVAAYQAGVSNATRYLRARSSSLPATLEISNNGNATDLRYAIYEWGGGEVDTGTAIELLHGTVTTNPAAAYYLRNLGTGTVTFSTVASGKYGTGAAPKTFTVGSATVGPAADTADIVIAGAIGGGEANGAITMVKGGPRKLTLSGNNVYTGGTTVTAGTLAARHANALGAAATGAVTVSSGATLEVGNSVAISKTATITIQGTGVNDGTQDCGAIWCKDGDNRFVGKLTLANNTSIRVEAGASLTLSGGVEYGNASYKLTKLGAGKLIIPGASVSAVTAETVVGDGVAQITYGEGKALPGNISVQADGQLAARDDGSYYRATLGGSLTMAGGAELTFGPPV